MKTKFVGFLTALMLSAFSNTMFAATIENPSFEVDTFTMFPGYVNDNGGITGWSGNDELRIGLNPSGGSPFADNGTIPDGSQVAFIQSDDTVVGGVTLGTLVTDLEIGMDYKVNFRVNARGGQTPNLKIDIDGVPIIATGITSVGGVAPYKYFAFDFNATSTSQLLTLRNDAAGDTTVVIDDFSIAPKDSGWSYGSWSDDASSGVDSSKTYTHAYSFGSSTPTTINGINFTGVTGVNPAVAGSFSTAGLPNVFNTDANNVTGGSQLLANDFLYSNAGLVESVTLNGLIPGGEYVVTLFSVGWEDGTRAATFSVGNDRLTVNQDQFGDNNGLIVSYHYVATGNSITLSYVPLQGNTFHTYGFANYVLSTPSEPAIGTQPRSQRVGAGEDVTFTVGAAGSDPLTYYWRKDGVVIGAPDSPTLTLASVTTAESGVYSVIVSNAFGTVISSNATLQVGLSIANRSFEADTFTVFPGYVSGNGPITGWDALGGHGINPGGGSPFADNGAIPDGMQVAFMQQDGGLSQLISGFNVGDAYYVVYYENARSGGVPALAVKIGDTTIVPAHTITPVGGSNPYLEVISDVFEASATDLPLSFIKSNPNGGDTTALIDDVNVIRIEPGTVPFITKEPLSQNASLNDAVTFTAGAVGSLPLSYQWRRNDTDIPGAQNASFSIAHASKGDEGDYTIVVSNTSGSVTSVVAHLSVFEPIGSLFNTGLDQNHVALADNGIDPNYSLIVNPDVASSDAIVEDSTAFPIVGGPWLANTASSKWIGPQFNTSASAVGPYTYRTTFNLLNRDPSTVVIIGRWSTDNNGRDILVNGVSTGNPENPGFNVYTPFTISTNNATFLPGINTIDFVVENVAAVGYTGLRAEFTESNARILPNIPPDITSSPVGQTVVEGDNVVLSVSASGSDPLHYQWARNGVTLMDETNRTLALPQIVECDSGEYSVTVSNGAGMTSSVPVTVTVAYQVVPGIYGTGVTDTGELAANGAVDLHYTLISSADANFPGPDAFVVTDGQFPIPPWLASGPDSKWIGPQADQSAGNAEGDYTYQTFFDLSGIDVDRFRIAGAWAVDNTGLDILLNGNSTGNANAAGFGGLTSFLITDGFVDGINSLEFVMNNAPTSNNPTGLRVDLHGLIDIRPVLSITPVDGSHVAVAWSSANACHRLQSAPTVAGPWTTITSATNPQIIDTTGQSALFFRILP